eukprot:Lithocolla_globosa_v1_NODE_8663_length_795_cov_1.444595.p2 type:complete len:209 gc:universal NODE_8663_length_795_cov_1.444595:139-765(+)
MYRILSILPGLIKAGSKRSGRLVAATTVTPFKASTPSNSANNCDKTLPVTSDDPSLSLLLPNASISSKKTMLGLAALALVNKVCTALSDSPTHLENNSGPLTAMKFRPDSVAKALAIRVFEQPGGPYRRMPLGGRMPMHWNSCGCWRGHSIASWSLCLASVWPPTSDHRTLGISNVISLIALGWISGSAEIRSCFFYFLFFLFLLFCM